MNIHLRVHGLEHVTETLQIAGRAAKDGAKVGVQKHLDAVAKASQAEVPVITEVLKKSLTTRVRERPAIFGIVEYTAPYALPVHEIPRPPSSTGKWRYLADPFWRLEGKYLPTVAKEVERALSKAKGRR